MYHISFEKLFFIIDLDDKTVLTSDINVIFIICLCVNDNCHPV